MIALWLGVVSGCVDPASEVFPDGDLPVDPSDPSTSPETDPDTTYYADVQPLLAENCARCHGPDGLPPGDFTDPAVASAWAEVMLFRIDSGEMPPPAADPDCHPYQGSDWMVLDPAMRDILARWIELDKPLGDPADGSAEIPTLGTLSRRDVELVAAAPVTPEFVDGNEYRCFLVDDGVDAEAFISGFEFLIDNPKISHHALLFVDPDGGSERLVTEPASQSWTCGEVQPEPEYLMIHAWAPSGGALEFPEGKGLKITRGSQLVIQMHYFAGETDPPPDQPGYALKIEPSVDEELFYVPLGPTDFVIPSGDPNFTATLDIPMWLLTFGVVSYDVYGVLPHMHVLATGYDFYATDADGNQKCISRGTDYDFAMQPTYWFDQPVHVSTEDTLSVSCTWDNSADNPRQLFDPPQNITWGENTQEEMCYALMYAAIRY